MEATQEAHTQCYNSKQVPGIAKLQKLLLAVNKYALVADVLIQHQPHVTAIVWGCIRFLIQVCYPLALLLLIPCLVNACCLCQALKSLPLLTIHCKVSVSEIELGQEIGYTLVEILKQIGRYELELQLFGDLPHVVNSIANLYAQIINYLVRANLHFSRSNAIRAARAAFSTKLSHILVSIEKSAVDLDREIRTASQKRQLAAGQLAEAEYAKQEAFRTGASNT